MVVPPRLLRAYRRTRYRVGVIDIRIGRRSAAMDSWMHAHGARCGVLVTAWNPRSRRMPPGWNTRAQKNMLEIFYHCVYLEAEGGFRRWHEAHVLVLREQRWVAHIARRFRQRGIVVLRPGRPARLILLPDPWHEPTMPTNSMS